MALAGDDNKRSQKTDGPCEEGVLTVHVKRVLPADEGKGAFNESSRILFRITIEGRTSDLPLRQTSDAASLMCNHQKHFLIEVPAATKRKEVTQSVDFALVRRSELLQLEEVIGGKSVDICGIQDESPFSGSMELQDERGVTVASVEADVLFNFGCLGYGNSLVFGKSEHGIQEKCQYSLFPRILPKDKLDSSGIHRSSHGIPRPPFIPFSQSASFYRSENSSFYGNPMSPRGTTGGCELKHITKELSRLPQLCQEYHQTKGRAERIAFLQRLLKASEGGPMEGLPSLAPHLTAEEAEGQQLMPEGVFRRRKTLEKIRL